MINKNFTAMVNFVTLAATGKCADIPADIDVKEVIKFASEHSVVPLVIAGMGKLDSFSGNPVYNHLLPISLQMVAMDIQRSFVIKEIFEKLKQNSVRFSILKGESIAVLYNEPDLRISSDVDLLVDRQDENKALKILDSYGYFYQKRPKWYNETVAKHEKNKLIEVHISLFDESRNDVFFKNLISEPKEFMNINTNNYSEIPVLKPDDGIMFVFLHFLKHFLGSGAGIRQLIDVIVYAKAYKEIIDWQKFFDVLKKMKYYNLFAYLITIAVEFLGLPKTEFPDVEYDVKKAEMVFCDLQKCGIFGSNEKELAEFRFIYEKRRFEALNNSDYSNYKSGMKKSKLHLIFPGLPYMKNRYAFVKKCSPLIVFAWFIRIVEGGLKLMGGKRTGKEYFGERVVVENEKIAERMKLIEDLGLI